MEIDDVAGYTVRFFLGKQEIQPFLIKHNMYSDYAIIGLINVHYLNDMKGSCYEKDIVTISRKGIEWKVVRAIRKLAKKGFLKNVGEDDFLGRNYKLSNKGRKILDQYVLYLREVERDRIYQIKENKRMSIEGEKKF